MKILFEEYKYQTEDVKNILGDFVLSGLDLTKDTQQLRYVGYFFNKNIVNHDGTKGDLVFILPKVLLDADGKAFGLDPLVVKDFNYAEWKTDEHVVEDGKLTKRNVYNFIYGFATWVYRAVDIYRKNLHNNPKEEQEDVDAEVMTSLQIGMSSKMENATFMDILLSLIDYQKSHKGFITYTIKMAHSGHNKVSWTQTIGRTSAVEQDGSPVYLNPINKKKVVDFDEELLIIYFSILEYIHDEYGFPTPNQPGYKLIKGAMFISYLKSQGKTRLHKIRYKYYSDDAVLLWNLCYAFFDKADKLKAQSSRKDFLLVNKFETVFEAMIDELVGDKNLPEGLKVSGDDKRIDHLYTYKYLLENLDGQNEEAMANDIYNIADSKYYRRDKSLRGHDVPKQFTYARNVIQWHMDLLHDLLEKDAEKAEKYKPIKLFDPITEGYNIIPNFFISAQVDDELNYNRANFAESSLGDGTNRHESYIFWERLFDRNSYFTLHYDVNFLFILKMYAQNKSYNKASWKMKVRNEFRDGILQYLRDEFRFYQVMVREDEIADFVERHYRKIIGKVFAFEDITGKNVLLYAERRNQDDGNGKSYRYDESNDAHIEGSLLIVPTRNKSAIYKILPINLALDAYKAVNPQRHEYAVVGYFKDQAHLDWIMANGIYNMRSKPRGRNAELSDKKLNATHLVLHNETLGKHIFEITGDSIYRIKKENLPQDEYVPSRDEYLIYEIDTPTVADECLNALVNSLRFQKELKKKKPFVIKMDKLRELAAQMPVASMRYKFEEEETFIGLVAEDEVEYLIK